MQFDPGKTDFGLDEVGAETEGIRDQSDDPAAELLLAPPARYLNSYLSINQGSCSAASIHSFIAGWLSSALQ